MKRERNMDVYCNFKKTKIKSNCHPQASGKHFVGFLLIKKNLNNEKISTLKHFYLKFTKIISQIRAV